MIIKFKWISYHGLQTFDSFIILKYLIMIILNNNVQKKKYIHI